MKMDTGNKWKQGNGILIFGTFMMIIGLSMTIMFIQTFIIRQKALDTQIAVDTVSDASAVYAMNESNRYEDVASNAQDVQKLIKDTTGVETKNMTIDRAALENDSTVQVSLSTQTPYLTGGYRGNSSYTITRSAATRFTGFTGGPLLSIAENKLGCLYYYGMSGPDMFDCSGFVSWCYQQAGGSGTRHTTDSLIAQFAGTEYEVSVNDLQPGDLIICNGTSHVVFYYGNGLVLGCSGGNTSTHGDNPNACVKFQNYEAAYKSSTTHVFRIPVEAF